MIVYARRLAALTVLCMTLHVGVAGCYIPGGRAGGHRMRHEIADAQTMKPLYPSAVLTLVGSTAPHFYQDPCPSRHVSLRTGRVFLLRHSRNAMRTAHYNPGYGFWPFLVVHEAEGQVILAPGYNPVGGGVGFEDLYEPVKKEALAAGDLDEEYREADAAFDAEAGAEARGKITLTPLYPSCNGEGKKRILVRHSILAFLLKHTRIWDDLRGRYFWGKDKESIALICKSILLMARAHQEKWPAYTWDRKQQRIIKWCQSVAGERGASHPS